MSESQPEVEPLSAFSCAFCKRRIPDHEPLIVDICGKDPTCCFDCFHKLTVWRLSVGELLRAELEQLCAQPLEELERLAEFLENNSSKDRTLGHERAALTSSSCAELLRALTKVPRQRE